MIPPPPTLAAQEVRQILIGPPSFERRSGVGDFDVAEDVLFGDLLLHNVPAPAARGGVGEGWDGVPPPQNFLIGVVYVIVYFASDRTEVRCEIIPAGVIVFGILFRQCRNHAR